MANVQRNEEPGKTRRSGKTSRTPEDIARDFDMGSAFGFLLRRMYSLTNQIFQQLCQDADLTPMQAGILLTVHREEIMGSRELARRMDVDRSTMQEVVNRLIKRKLIDRRVPESDRRTYELWLTPEGRDLLFRNIETMDRLEAEILKGVDPEHVAITKSVFKTVLATHNG